MVTLHNYPVYPPNKKYKSLVYELIRRRQKQIRSLKDKSKPTFLTIGKHTEKKVLPQIDSIKFFKTYLSFFELLRKKVEFNYREFFFQCSFRNFGRINDNFGGKSVRGLS